MKALTTLLFVLLACYCKGNAIDKLKTLADVNRFLESKCADKDASFFDGLKKDSTTKLSRTRFIKIDLNNDGLTDLLVNGTHLFAVIDKGNNNFEFDLIDGGIFFLRQYILVDINKELNTPRIIVKRYTDFGRPQPNNTAVNRPKDQYDTLMLKYNGFIEYNKTPDVYEISKLTFSTSACLGTCPIFDLSVNADGTILYNAYRYNKKKGKFKSTFDLAAKKTLFDLVNYINPRKLADAYAVGWTDDQTVYLTIVYKDGTIKSIKDYGAAGTFGLHQLYGILFAMPGRQKWARL